MIRGMIFRLKVSANEEGALCSSLLYHKDVTR